MHGSWLSSTKIFAQTFWMLTAWPGGPPISADGKREIITIGKGSRSVEICGELVSENANWFIRSDTLAIEFSSEEGQTAE